MYLVFFSRAKYTHPNLPLPSDLPISKSLSFHARFVPALHPPRAGSACEDVVREDMDEDADRPAGAAKVDDEEEAEDATEEEGACTLCVWGKSKQEKKMKEE